VFLNEEVRRSRAPAAPAVGARTTQRLRQTRRSPARDICGDSV